MSDKELLELAAKAVGFQHNPTVKFDNKALYGCFSSDARQEEYRWSPLTDDGDALRLAVKLRMKVEVDYSDSFRYVTSAKCWSKEIERCVFASEEVEPDPYAATRRAIVRAAAEIGKGE